MEEILAQLLPCTNQVALQTSVKLQQHPVPYTDLQNMMAASSLLPSKSQANFSYDNSSPDHSGKGILGNVVLVAKLTQYKIITVVKSEIPGRLSTVLSYGGTTKLKCLTYLNYLPCARCSCKHFTYIHTFNPFNNPNCFHYPYFTDEKTETWRGSPI